MCGGVRWESFSDFFYYNGLKFILVFNIWPRTHWRWCEVWLSQHLHHRRYFHKIFKRQGFYNRQIFIMGPQLPYSADNTTSTVSYFLHFKQIQRTKFSNNTWGKRKIADRVQDDTNISGNYSGWVVLYKIGTT